MFSLFLSGCRQKCSVTPLVRGISFSCAVKYYNECYEGDVSVAENGDTDIKITSPEGLAGLILHFKGENAAAEYQRLVERHTVAYRDEIEKYAAENGIHPAYVAAIILRESSYDPKATSSVGARGLMQIMPETGEWLAGKFGEAADYAPDRLFDANTNLRYGCWYLGYLSRMFNGDPIKIACAYHAGPNNVKLWIMNYTADGQTLTLDEIPKDDSRYYAGKVVNAYDIYYQHYYPDAY